jgi:lysophospholipase L1-like esterase
MADLALRVVPRVMPWVAFPLLPVLAVQGRAVRRRTPRLPAAAGPVAGVVVGAGPPLRLVVVGESTVAGVGAGSHAEALSGQVAVALARRTGRAVRWRAVGRIGVTASAARECLLPALREARADVVVVAVGINDVLRLTSLRRWRRDLARLLDALRGQVGPAGPDAVEVLLAGVPSIGRFPALPQPLRGLLGLHAWALDTAGRRLAAALPRTTHLPTRLDPAVHSMASDGFHPSPSTYAAWGDALAAAAAARLSRRSEATEETSPHEQRPSGPGRRGGHADRHDPRGRTR